MRKGHGSTKVPGVKLRPAAPSKSTSESRQSAWAAPTDDVDASDILRSCKKPFNGAVVCASGLSDKATLFQQAVQLGAQTSTDLTDRVTHLICSGPGSAKYTYCVEHGIPIALPSWISDSYVKWLAGEDVEIESSINVHRLLPFHSVRLCVTGFGNIEKRNQIHKLLVKGGGVFIQSLELNTTITHLLCGAERGNEVDERGWTQKMQFVEKANRKRKDKIKIVWEEWFWDCLEFQGQLNDVNYSINNPRPNRKTKRETTPLLAPISSATSVSPTRQRSIPPSVPSSSLLRSTDAEEMATVKRVPETTVQLWKGLLKNRGFDLKSGKLSRSPQKFKEEQTKLEGNKERASTPPSPIRAGKLPADCDTRPSMGQGTGSSLSTAFGRSKSFAPKATPTPSTEISKIPLQRTPSAPVSAFPSSVADLSREILAGPSTLPVDPIVEIPEGERNIFLGLKFRALGDANGPKMTQAIELRGGIMSSDPEKCVDYIIVRLASSSTIYQNEPSENEKRKFRTECWIEQCIFNEKVCEGNEHLAFCPLQTPLPIRGAEKLKLHISGLSASEKTPALRLIKAIGATVTDQLSRRNTHLLCPSGTGPKFDKAQEWRIPVVNLSWLYATVKSGEIQGSFDFLVASADRPASELSLSTAQGGIMDITNSDFVQGSAKGKAPEKEDCESSFLSHAAQSSCTEPESDSSWKTNGLLSDTFEVPRSVASSSPCKNQGPRNSARPSTPLSERKWAVTELIVLNDARDKPLDRLTRISSSTTPSPLKMPDETFPTSPSTMSAESASVLKGAITSLLGKRQSSDDSDNPVQPRRNGKRSKPPPRSKSKQEPFSRTSSTDKLARTCSAPSEYPLFMSEDSKVPSLELEAADESMRVTYEDPSQQDEKRRLLSLINNEPLEPEQSEKSNGRKGRNLVRRNSKVPRF